MSVFTKWLIVVVLAGLSLAVGEHWYAGKLEQARQDGAAAERAVWVEKDRQREAAEKAAVLKQAQDDFAKRAEDARINLQVEADHAKAVQDLKTRVAALDAESRAYGGLRIPKALCAGSDGSSLPAGSQADGPDGIAAYLAGTIALPEDTQRRLRAVAIEADEVVENIRTVQNWAIAKGYVAASDIAPAQ